MGPHVETTESAAPALLVLSQESILVRITLCGVDTPCDGITAIYYSESNLGSPLQENCSAGSARGDGHKRQVARPVPTHHKIVRGQLMEMIERRISDGSVLQLIR